MKILKIIGCTFVGCFSIWMLTLVSIVSIGGLLEPSWYWKTLGAMGLTLFLLSGYALGKDTYEK